MKLILFQGKIPVCVEDFPSDAERSVKDKGAIHLRPGRAVELTDDEYAYIMAHREDLKKQVVLLRSK